MNPQTPSVGRIVLYQMYYGEPAVPAIITKVEGVLLHLTVFLAHGGPVSQITSTEWSPVGGSEYRPVGSWFWPPRV